MTDRPSWWVHGLSIATLCCAGQFVETFDGPVLAADPSAVAGWAWRAGDGSATIAFSQADGIGRIHLDASTDERNIWWAFIRRAVTPDIDVEELARPDRELRVVARIRSDTAPRRVNLHLNHSRTTDFHSHLMEYDLPVAGEWRDISLTTGGFDAQPGDEVFVQLALMDWGLGHYRVELDEIEVRVVDPATTGPDLGEPLPYQPPPSPPEAFRHALAPSADAVVDPAWPGVNFAGWGTLDGQRLLSAGGTRLSLLRWDLADFADRQPSGWGLLSLHVRQVERAVTGLKDFGLLRVVEILGGEADWQRDSVTWSSFSGGRPRDAVLNAQLIMDVLPEAGARTLVPVSPPVLRRLLSGQSRGLALQAQGAISASFNPTGSEQGPMLHFNLEE